MLALRTKHTDSIKRRIATRNCDTIALGWTPSKSEYAASNGINAGQRTLLAPSTFSYGLTLRSLATRQCSSRQATSAFWWSTILTSTNCSTLVWTIRDSATSNWFERRLRKEPKIPLQWSRQRRAKVLDTTSADLTRALAQVRKSSFNSTLELCLTLRSSSNRARTCSYSKLKSSPLLSEEDSVRSFKASTRKAIWFSHNSAKQVPYSPCESGGPSQRMAKYCRRCRRQKWRFRCSKTHLLTRSSEVSTKFKPCTKTIVW